MSLFAFGLGYSAQHYLLHHGAGFDTAATVTSPGRAAALARPRCDVFVFSPEETDPRIAARLAHAEAILVSAPPDAAGDPVLAAFGETMAASKNLERIIYLSTLGVYGDHGGAWIDESAPCNPVNARSLWRLQAEDAWRKLGEDTGRAVHVLRLAGIYGPGRNALVNLRAGTARRILKPGQVFNRIHVADIARAIDACVSHEGSGGVWNIADDEPAPAEDVVTYAASLLGIEPPPEIPFDEARMSPIARSFYAEVKRASNRAMKQQLGVRLAFPTYREGLRALLAEDNATAP